jgi:hypothetical protein
MTGDDDELLRELGRAVRATERNDDAKREERLSSHSLAPDELADMQARAESDDELARALDAHAPLGAEVKARISAELVAVAQRQSALPKAAAATPARVVALQPRAARARRAVWLALPLCAAAAALLWLAVGLKRIAPIPAYDLVISGAQAETRSGPVTIQAGDSQKLVRIADDAQLHLLLRPATAVAGSVAARVYLTHDGTLVDWPAHSQQAESGALQLVLAAAPGPIAGSDVLIVVGRPELLAARGEALARAAQAQGEGFQRWRVRLAAGR